MNDYSKDFAEFKDKIWFNAGGEGPLPLVAVKAAYEAIEWKKYPFMLDNYKFASVPLELKHSLGRLMNVSADDVVLGNSASYGLHLIANGYPFEPGNEILLMQNDFPSNILAFLALEEKGINVTQLKAKDKILTPQEVDKHLSSRTKLFCISHVHTFSGHKVDIEAIGKICKQKGVVFVVNMAHSLGTKPIDVSQINVDAVVGVGYKWLCGPYGTGFLWMTKNLREKLSFNQSYWISMLSQEELKSEEAICLRALKTSRKYDVFGTANFFNFVPWRASIDYLLGIGLEKIESHHQKLIDQFVSGLNRQKYFLISPDQGPNRSSLIVFSHQKSHENERVFNHLLEKGIHATVWKGNIRITPHIYNNSDQISFLLNALERF